MARTPKPWWNEKKGTWCSDIGGKRQTLAKGKKNRKVALRTLKQLLDEQVLLADVNGAVTVARLCEEFVEDARENLELRTYETYLYGCQKFVDQFGAKLAHTIEPGDIKCFSKRLKNTLSDTTRGMVGQSRSLHFLTNDEFQCVLRATNPRNNHRSGACLRRLLLALDWTLCTGVSNSE